MRRTEDLRILISSPIAYYCCQISEPIYLDKDIAETKTVSRPAIAPLETARDLATAQDRSDLLQAIERQLRDLGVPL